MGRLKCVIRRPALPWQTQCAYAGGTTQVDWANLLFVAGIADSPGRAEAVQKAVQRSKERGRSRAGSKRTNKAQGRHFPGLKHSGAMTFAHLQ